MAGSWAGLRAGVDHVYSKLLRIGGLGFGEDLIALAQHGVICRRIQPFDSIQPFPLPIKELTLAALHFWIEFGGKDADQATAWLGVARKCRNA